MIDNTENIICYHFSLSHNSADKQSRVLHACTHTHRLLLTHARTNAHKHPFLTLSVSGTCSGHTILKASPGFGARQLRKTHIFAIDCRIQDCITVDVYIGCHCKVGSDVKVLLRMLNARKKCSETRCNFHAKISLSHYIHR